MEISMQGNVLKTHLKVFDDKESDCKESIWISQSTSTELSSNDIELDLEQAKELRNFLDFVLDKGDE